MAEFLPLFFEAGQLIVDAGHRSGDLFSALFVRYLRILARKLLILARQVSDQLLQLGFRKSHVVSYSAFWDRAGIGGRERRRGLPMADCVQYNGRKFK